MGFDLQLHGDNVYKLSIQIGKKMRLNKDELRNLALSALMHDVGKLFIPKELLNKNADLTYDEMEIMKQHPILGAHHLRRKDFNSEIVKAVLFHHERYDGKGYNKGLKGDEIPLLSRIISLADSYDAMTSKRPYKKPLTELQAMKELTSHIGTQFDPEITTIFINILKSKLESRVV